MTVEVTTQAAHLAIFAEKLNVVEQSAYAAIFAGTRVSITDQSAYLALFYTAPPTRPRRVVAIASG